MFKMLKTLYWRFCFHHILKVSEISKQAIWFATQGHGKVLN